jgi:beta-lactamase regulating signal transducer with metallopeptidase domain
MTLILECAARGLALMAVAAIGVRVCRVHTPQVRHLIWTVVLVGSLAMPLLTELLRESVMTPVVFVIPDVARSVAFSTPTVVAESYWWELYLAVAGVLLFRVALGTALLLRIAKRALVWNGNVRISGEVRGPVTFGRTILLPEGYKEWPAHEREAVLRHEFAHCGRGDFYTQLLSKIHRAVFWFNPMSWWLDRHLADLAEQACDEAAVQSQTQCPDYAALLLRLATGADWRTEAGVAMARVSSVTKRVERLLDEAFEPGRKMSRTRKLQVLGVLLPLMLLPALFQLQLLAQTTRKERSWAITSSDNKITMSGDTNDIKKARAMRVKKGRDVLWFRQGGAEYVVDDPQILDEARALFPRNEKLEAEMEALGKQQEALGKQQEALGRLQQEVKVPAPDIDDAEFRRLAARLAELKAKAAAISQEELSEMQGRLGELQAKLGELQSIAGGKQAELGEKQAVLGGKQAELGGKQAVLGEQMARESEKAVARLNALIDRLIAEGKAQRVN